MLCVVSPELQVLFVPLEVRVTEPPLQKEVGPEVVIVGAEQG
jgi:hypothetical protein